MIVVSKAEMAVRQQYHATLPGNDIVSMFTQVRSEVVCELIHGQDATVL